MGKWIGRGSPRHLRTPARNPANAQSRRRYDPRQEFYAGLTRERELEHDAQVPFLARPRLVAERQEPQRLPNRSGCSADTWRSRCRTRTPQSTRARRRGPHVHVPSPALPDPRATARLLGPLHGGPHGRDVRGGVPLGSSSASRLTPLAVSVNARSRSLDNSPSRQNVDWRTTTERNMTVSYPVRTYL